MTEATKETTALAVRPATTALSGYVPPPGEAEWDSMVRMANSLAKAQGFLPAHFFGQPYKILAAILYGRDLGISPTNALQHIIVIEGKATADAQLIGMLVRRAGHRLEDVTTETQSTVKITRGDDGSVHTFVFSMDDAKTAGLARPGSAWTKFPKAMLYARALTGCARKAAQDALMGTIYTPEEIGAETDAEGNVTAPPAPPSPDIVVEGELVNGPEIPSDKATPESVAALKQAQDVTAVSGTAAPGPASAQVNNGAVTAGGPVAAPSAPPRGGPRAKRGNVVPAPQGAPGERSAAGATADGPSTAIQPPAMTPAPPVGLAEPEDGKAEYVVQLRNQAREVAAQLQSLRVRLHNHKHAAEIALGNKAPQAAVPALPNPGSDRALDDFIAATYPGRTLADLGEAELDGSEAAPGILRTLDALVERVSKALPA